MCRLLGAVSAEIVDYRLCLQRAPRSLAALSPEHPHGWGLALHDGRGAWSLHRSVACATEDERFHALAAEARGRLLIAHVRKKTVGVSSLENTHPFRRGRWVFAHNGTIEDTSHLERRTSGARRREIEGQTDSERLFSYLLTAIDRAGATHGVARAKEGAVDAALGSATRALTAREGAANFLLSDGQVLFAFRWGRTLHVLERGGERRTAAVVVASTPTTDEAWREVEEGTLLRIDGGGNPRMRVIEMDRPAPRAPRAPRATPRTRSASAA
jgi:glutamine amidotransferase